MINDLNASVVNISDGTPCDVYIGRPSKYGNPFKSGTDGTRSQVIEMYRQYVLSNLELYNSILELDGKVLGCFCKPNACHGDVIVQLIEQHKREALFER